MKDYIQGINFFKRNEYKKAYDLLKKAADENNSHACVFLGTEFYDDDYTSNLFLKPDGDWAFYYARKAHKLGNLEGTALLSRMLKDGVSITYRNKKLSKKLDTIFREKMSNIGEKIHKEILKKK